MTSANMIGVSSGTRSSRGVRAVSRKRRRASVASGASGPGRAGRGEGTAISRLDMALLRSGGSGQRVAGQAQVDVVECRLASADRSGEPQLVDCRDRLVRAPVV